MAGSGETVKPRAPRGTINRPTSGPRRAAHTRKSAAAASGTNIFRPFSAKPASVGCALSYTAPGSQRASASSNAKVARASPIEMRERYLRFWAGLPAASMATPASVRGKIRPRQQGAAHFFERHRHLDQAKAQPAVLFIENDARPALVGHLLPQRGVVGGGGFHLPAHFGDGANGRERLARRILQYLLGLGQSELHGAFLSSS